MELTETKREQICLKMKLSSATSGLRHTSSSERPSNRIYITCTGTRKKNESFSVNTQPTEQKRLIRCEKISISHESLGGKNEKICFLKKQLICVCSESNLEKFHALTPFSLSELSSRSQHFQDACNLYNLCHRTDSTHPLRASL